MAKKKEDPAKIEQRKAERVAFVQSRPNLAPAEARKRFFVQTRTAELGAAGKPVDKKALRQKFDTGNITREGFRTPTDTARVKARNASSGSSGSSGTDTGSTVVKPVETVTQVVTPTATAPTSNNGESLAGIKGRGTTTTGFGRSVPFLSVTSSAVVRPQTSQPGVPANISALFAPNAPAPVPIESFGTPGKKYTTPANAVKTSTIPSMTNKSQFKRDGVWTTTSDAQLILNTAAMAAPFALGPVSGLVAYTGLIAGADLLGGATAKDTAKTAGINLAVGAITLGVIKGAGKVLSGVSQPSTRVPFRNRPSASMAPESGITYTKPSANPTTLTPKQLKLKAEADAILSGKLTPKQLKLKAKANAILSGKFTPEQLKLKAKADAILSGKTAKNLGTQSAARGDDLAFNAREQGQIDAFRARTEPSPASLRQSKQDAVQAKADDIMSGKADATDLSFNAREQAQIDAFRARSTPEPSNLAQGKAADVVLTPAQKGAITKQKNLQKKVNADIAEGERIRLAATRERNLQLLEDDKIAHAKSLERVEAPKRNDFADAIDRPPTAREIELGHVPQYDDAAPSLAKSKLDIANAEADKLAVTPKAVADAKNVIKNTSVKVPPATTVVRIPDSKATVAGRKGKSLTTAGPTGPKTYEQLVVEAGNNKGVFKSDRDALQFITDPKSQKFFADNPGSEAEFIRKNPGAVARGRAEAQRGVTVDISDLPTDYELMTNAEKIADARLRRSPEANAALDAENAKDVKDAAAAAKRKATKDARKLAAEPGKGGVTPASGSGKFISDAEQKRLDELGQ